MSQENKLLWSRVPCKEYVDELWDNRTYPVRIAARIYQVGHTYHAYVYESDNSVSEWSKFSNLHTAKSRCEGLVEVNG